MPNNYKKLKKSQEARDNSRKSNKANLVKPQDNIAFKNTYAGPLTESDTKRLDQSFPSTVTPKIPFAASKPNMGYGTEDQYRKMEKEDRASFENYLRSPAVGENNKRLGTGLDSGAIWNQKYKNKDAQLNEMNKMNNIDWNSEEGSRTKKILDRDYKEAIPFKNADIDRMNSKRKNFE